MRKKKLNIDKTNIAKLNNYNKIRGGGTNHCNTNDGTEDNDGDECGSGSFVDPNTQ